MTALERTHVERVKALNCSVCGVEGPSEAHEIKQGQWFTSISLCPDCHRHPVLGIHGQRTTWRVRKLDELDALAMTIRALLA